MAIAVEGTGSALVNYAHNATVAYTVPANTTLLEFTISSCYVESQALNNPPSAVSYNGVSMTKAKEFNFNCGAALDPRGWCQKWVLLSPDTGSSHNFAITDHNDGIIGVCSILSLSGTTTYRTPQTASDVYIKDNGTVEPTIGVTTVSGDLAVITATMGHQNETFPGSVTVTNIGGQTEDVNDKSTFGSTLDAWAYTGHKAATTTTTTMGCTLGGGNSHWGIIGIAYIPTASTVLEESPSGLILAPQWPANPVTVWL